MLMSARLGAVAIVTATLLVGCAPAEPVVSPTSEDVAPIEEPTEPEPASNSSMTMLVDGVEWIGSDASASFFSGGAPSFDPEGRTYLQLAFPSASSTDSRQLTFGFFGFTGSTGALQDIAEVNFSGSPTGGTDDTVLQGYQYDVPEQKTNFVFEVTKWESTGTDTAVMSATFSGDLVGILGSPPAVISNGVITDLEVIIYPDPF